MVNITNDTKVEISKHLSMKNTMSLMNTSKTDKTLKAVSIGHSCGQDQVVISKLVKKGFTKAVIKKMKMNDVKIQDVLVNGVRLDGYKPPRLTSQMKINQWENKKENAKRLSLQAFGPSGVKVIESSWKNKFNNMRPYQIFSAALVIVAQNTQAPKYYFSDKSSVGHSFRIAFLGSLLDNIESSFQSIDYKEGVSAGRMLKTFGEKFKEANMNENNNYNTNDLWEVSFQDYSQIFSKYINDENIVYAFLNRNVNSNINQELKLGYNFLEKSRNSSHWKKGLKNGFQ